MPQLKSREDRCRRALACRGWRLKKTPSRSWLRQHYGPGYMVIDIYSNRIVEGYVGREYCMALEDVEALVLGDVVSPA